MPTTEHSFTFENRERTYEVFVPFGYSRRKKYPVVINLHGGGGNAKAHAYQTKMNVCAQKNGFIVVYPEGTAVFNTALVWNAGLCCGYAVTQNINDVGFISKVIDKVNAEFSTNPKKVYCTGMSNGAMLSHRLAVELSNKIAAICAVSASLGIELPSQTKPIPIMELRGSADKNAPVLGGIGENAFAKVVHKSSFDVMSNWASNNKCKPATISNIDGNFKFEYDGEFPVILYLILNGGHQWFGGETVAEDICGPMVDFPSNDVMWDFFKRFSL